MKINSLRLLYVSKKHRYSIWKNGRIVWFVSKDTTRSAHLDNEFSMENFKRQINEWINKRNEQLNNVS